MVTFLILIKLMAGGVKRQTDKAIIMPWQFNYKINGLAGLIVEANPQVKGGFSPNERDVN
jgi:hypothetical protein